MRYAICHPCGRLHRLYLCVKESVQERLSFNSLFLLLSYYRHHFPIVVVTAIHFSLFPFGAFVHACNVVYDFSCGRKCFSSSSCMWYAVFSHNTTNNKRSHRTLTLSQPKQMYYRSCITGCVDYDIGEMKFTLVTLLNAFDDDNNSLNATWVWENVRTGCWDGDVAHATQWG